MAILVKNLATGETKKVFNVRINNDEIVAEWQRPDPDTNGKFGENYPFLKKTEKVQHHDERDKDCRVFELEDGFEVVKKERTKSPKAESAKKEPTPKKQESANEQPQPQPKAESDENTDDALQLAKLLQRMKGGNIDAEQVQKIVEDTLARMAKDEPKKVNDLAKKAAAKQSGKESEYYCDGFDAMVQDVADGYCVYMHGPAGTGKSHTAKQIAERLGLPFFESMQMEFAHEAKGYGDASGSYVPTPLYKAVTEGGLYFMDEFDRSRQEVTTVINTLLANRRFDFPVIGNVEAHPNFRVVAAGNTVMMGADDGYVAANELDTSTRDRFAFYEVNYDRRVELNVIAQGDEETVNFVEDVRKAVAACNLLHVVSYRATDYMVSRKKIGVKLVDILKRKTFAGLKPDEIRIIYGQLQDQSNTWAKAMKKLF